MHLSYILGALALISAGLALWQVAVAMRFPLNRRRPCPAPAPAMALLKPLKGCDAETAACLRSWFEQDYPGQVQLLFGVASADDPVCDVVRQLIAAHPRHDAQLVICPKQFGPNAKVSTLIHLEALARHEIVVVSDADVRVPPDLLAQIAGPLSEPGVGLAHCFYRMAQPANLAMRLEAFAVNADFWSQVLQARTLNPMDFALGAVMAMTRAQLGRIGGFAALVDYLADDFQLGNRISAQARVELCPVVIECRSAPQGWREVWAHQLRWARTIRICRPAPFFFSVLADASFWALLWLLSRPIGLAAMLAGGCLAIRMTTAFLLERKFTGRADLNSFWLAPLKDLLRVTIWALAFAGHRIVWRGEQFEIQRGGKLVKAR